jgi:hypothetical protein
MTMMADGYPDQRLGGDTSIESVLSSSLVL